MVTLVDLWMPIVLSAVIVFVASSVIWMATPLHKHDYKDPGDKEDSILGMLKSASFAPGVYFVPWCHGKEKDPVFIERQKTGPWAQLIVRGSAPNIGQMLGAWMVHLVLVGVFVAYIGTHAGLAPGAEYLRVFRIVGTAAFLAYGGYSLPLCIWHAQPWAQLPGRLIDGLIYALLTAGTFAWMWPGAVNPALP